MSQQVGIEINVESSQLTANDISILGRNFVDSHGRILHLRGANVGAASKVPNDPKGKLHEHADVSYTGRPFPLSEAAEHWKRLRSWGLTFVRITVTWDAIEHAGPGKYDEEYLQYLRALLEGMREYGLVAYVAVHQDVWSRYCGGSGAPGWTLEAAGFDLSNDGEALVQTGAAFLDGIRGGRLEGERGLWPTGYQKLAAASMNTFFWGGETFAPKLKVKTPQGEKNIQSFLQDAFLGAVERLVDAVGDLDTVLGVELLNEPHPGFIGLSSIHDWNYNTDLHLGAFPSPLQSFSLGAGHATDVPVYTRSFPWPTRITSRTTLNKTNAIVWTRPEGCPWEEAGVWRWSDQKGKAVALQEDYFSKSGKSFYNDFYWPFVRKWEAVVARAGKEGKGGKQLMRMVEAIPNEFCPVWPENARPSNFVYAPHWYDLNALFKKQMGNMTVNVQGLSRGMFVLKALYYGDKGVKTNYRVQIRNIVREARQRLGDVPVVFGECGVPMDLNEEQALKTGDWKWQARMMDAMMSAFEANLVGFNLWTYNPSNTDAHGDDWNAENFSWYSDANRQTAIKAGEATADDLDAGGRLIDTVVRPYAIATSGTPVELKFDLARALFTYRFVSPTRPVPAHGVGSPDPSEITELYLPRHLWKSLSDVQYILSPGGVIKFDLDRQRAHVWWYDGYESLRRKTQQQPRRVDMWVKERNVTKTRDIMIPTVAIGWLVLMIVAAWWAQQWQWSEEKAADIKIPDGWI